MYLYLTNRDHAWAQTEDQFGNLSRENPLLMETLGENLSHSLFAHWNGIQCHDIVFLLE